MFTSIPNYVHRTIFCTLIPNCVHLHQILYMTTKLCTSVPNFGGLYLLYISDAVFEVFCVWGVIFDLGTLCGVPSRVFCESSLF